MAIPPFILPTTPVVRIPKTEPEDERPRMTVAEAREVIYRSGALKVGELIDMLSDCPRDVPVFIDMEVPVDPITDYAGTYNEMRRMVSVKWSPSGCCLTGESLASVWSEDDA